MINNRWNSDRQQSKMTYNQLHNGLKSPKTQEKRLKPQRMLTFEAVVFLVVTQRSRSG